MKNFHIPLFCMAILFLVVQSCQAPCPEVEEAEPGLLEISSTIDQDIEMVTAYMNALVSSDSAAIRSYLTDDFMSYYMTSPTDSSNANEHIAAWKSFGEQRSNQANEIVAASSLKVNSGRFEGNWVQVWGTYSATWNDSGTAIEIPYHVNLNIVDGKISREYGYYDRLAINVQLGYELTRSE